MKSITKEQAAKILGEPNGAEKLFQDAEAAFDAAWELFLEGGAPACAFLCRCAKRNSLRAEIERRIDPAREPLTSFIHSDQSKLRKNAARLMSELKNPADVGALIGALDREETRLVIPSILLALGAIGGEEAEKRLNAHTVKTAANPGEERHAREEAEALQTARARFLKLEKHVFTGLSHPYEMELRTPDRLSDSLKYELLSINIEALRSYPDAVTVKTADISALYSCRSFYETLFVAGRSIPLNPKAIAIHCAGFLKTLLAESHNGRPPYGYRIELRHSGGDDASRGNTHDGLDRGSFSRALKALLDSEILKNSPGNYEAELRIEAHRGGGADIYVKLHTIPDGRFAYRLDALPASMHPATAAAILRYARSRLKAGARVLDPCCGSGTFLIERGKLTDCASLTGVDIAHNAIDIARKNAAAAGSNAKFVTNDLMRFEAGRQYDELIANLPFGNRVGSHKQNERLYAALLGRLQGWLVPGGTAVLYTMEFTLLKKLIRERPELKLITETRTDAGGLMPGVFIIEVR